MKAQTPKPVPLAPATPGERAGIATARGVNKTIRGVIYGLVNVRDFATGFWRGHARTTK